MTNRDTQFFLSDDHKGMKPPPTRGQFQIIHFGNHMIRMRNRPPTTTMMIIGAHFRSSLFIVLSFLCQKFRTTPSISGFSQLAQIKPPGACPSSAAERRGGPFHAGGMNSR